MILISTNMVSSGASKKTKMLSAQTQKLQWIISGGNKILLFIQ